ncbi:MAG: M20/M25/M40 family metallo-hydrolase [Magnetococcales bacterium]|nr:M20/M25/M40 family metallo-hydrolase [Magnetococcales bacterium]
MAVLGSILLVIILIWGMLFFVSDMPGDSFEGAPPPLTRQEMALSQRLKNHVHYLADTIGERNVWHPGTLERSVAYIEQHFKAMGLPVTRRPYALEGEAGQRMEGAVYNLEVELAGGDPERGVMVIGAHYDTVPASPGANDNGTGVAGLLELARLLQGQTFHQTIRLVAFVNEEPPFFQTPEMGSQVYARESQAAGERITAMYALETIGYFSNRPHSQSYPFPLGLIYPNQGHFIAFVANPPSRSLLHQTLGIFRHHATIPSEGLAAPSFIPGVDWSDHASFWEYDIPAVMITDTAPYRYPHYHQPEDTPDKIDYAAFTRVVSGLADTFVELASNKK